MKTSLRLTTRQQIALTPQIQHAIRMLQLGAKELSEEIDETLKNNPLLQEIKIYQSSSNRNDEFSSWLENQASKCTENLESHLIKQLRFLSLDSESYVITCIIISSLDEDGYLRASESMLLNACKKEQIIANTQQLNNAINVIKQLDPVGIASHDLSECLQQQIRYSDKEPSIQKNALRICQQLDLLSKNKNKLQQELGLNEQDFQRALNLLKQLDPFPGKSFNEKQTIYIQPDILLNSNNDQISIQLNPAINRRIELNQYYIDLLKQTNKARDKDYLKKNLNNARWWLNALLQRNKTLFLVAQHMIKHQIDYFSNGKSSLKPLKQQQIADSLNIHISTVSRAIRDKYIQAPMGVIKLKALLAGSIKVENEKSLSNEAVKQIIMNLIKNESSQRPLSDSKIVAELKIRGIIIARRTVNKYREQLNIPASNRRKVI